MHRDVKPQNMILGEDGIVLVDFGVARELGEEDDGTIGVGTPRFMAPEVFAGGVVSTRSDVFGLAASLWTLIVGKPPVYADPTKLSDIAADVPPALEETISAGLEMIPERVASVSAFAKALGAPLGRVERRVARDQRRAAGCAAAPSWRASCGLAGASRSSSIALTDATTGELVYQSAGAGGREIVGVRLPPGMGGRGAVVQRRRRGGRVPHGPRFATQIAAGTGYTPYTMLCVPLMRNDRAIGVLSVLDRRDGGLYGPGDMERASCSRTLPSSRSR